MPRTAETKQCYHCQGIGHVQADCPTLRISGGAAGNRCYSCGLPGHLARDCPTPGVQQAPAGPVPGRGGFGGGRGGFGGPRGGFGGGRGGFVGGAGGRPAMVSPLWQVSSSQQRLTSHSATVAEDPTTSLGTAKPRLRSATLAESSVTSPRIAPLLMAVPLTLPERVSISSYLYI